MNCFYLVCNIAKKFYYELEEMERQFRTQFFKDEPDVCIVELSRVTQRSGETTYLFIARFKIMRNRCKIYLLETKSVKMGHKGGLILS